MCWAHFSSWFKGSLPLETQTGRKPHRLLVLWTTETNWLFPIKFPTVKIINYGLKEKQKSSKRNGWLSYVRNLWKACSPHLYRRDCINLSVFTLRPSSTGPLCSVCPFNLPQSTLVLSHIKTHHSFICSYSSQVFLQRNLIHLYVNNWSKFPFYVSYTLVLKENFRL